VFFSFAVLLAGVQAMSSSLYQKRAALDVCSNVGCSVSLPNPLDGKTIKFGDLNVCLCLSGIPGLVKSDPILLAASLIVGSSKVTDYITSQVKKGGQNCNYPDHATPVCASHDPCSFDCGDGYSASDKKCVCKPPYTECNGKCGTFRSCPSKNAQKRDADEWKEHAKCDRGYAACGVLGRSKLTRESYECVDAKNNLESCGGCTIPLHRGSPIGTDCTSLPGVADVSCMNGACNIHKCMPGYQLSIDNTMCMDEDTIKKFMTVAEFGWERLVPIGFD